MTSALPPLLLSPFLAAKKESILSALSSQDLVRLRELASEEGGYVDDETRAKVWPFLLGLSPSLEPSTRKEDELISPTDTPSLATDSFVTPLSPQAHYQRETSTSSFVSEDPGTTETASASGLSESWIHPSSSSSASSFLPPSSQRSSFDSDRNINGLEDSWIQQGDDNETDQDQDQRGRGKGRGGDGTSSTLLFLDSSSSPSLQGASVHVSKSNATSLSPCPSSRSPSPTHLRNSTTAVQIEPSSSLLFPSPNQSFAQLPPLPCSPPPTSPPPTYSSSTSTAALAPVEWGLFEAGGAEELEVHRDEGQIRLDTRRGFVVWPDVNQKSRVQLQTSLHALIVTVLRRHPPCRYFQGFHDISSVLLLTFLPLSTLLPPTRLNHSTPSSSAHNTPQHLSSSSPSHRPSSTPGAYDGLSLEKKQQKAREKEIWEREQAELCAKCLERLSLFRIRDGMGEGLEPVMGLLRLMKRLLRVADPELSKVVNQATPLPFFALSWLLTLFSHDVDSFSIIQLLFDFLLSHNPVVVVYLSVAARHPLVPFPYIPSRMCRLTSVVTLVSPGSQIVLSKKPLILTLSSYLVSDPGLLHTTLASLPPFLVGAPSPTSSTTSPIFIPPPDTSAPLPPLSPSSDTSSPPSQPSVPLPLPTLFAITTKLYTDHPPFALVSDGGIDVGEVMGRRSVVFTYEEERAAFSASKPSFPSIANDEEVAEAERVVGCLGEMVNLDYVEKVDSENEDDDGGEKGAKRRTGRIVRLPTTSRSRFGALGMPSWAVGVAVLVVVGAVGVGVWGASSSREGHGGAWVRAWVVGRVGMLEGLVGGGARGR